MGKNFSGSSWNETKFRPVLDKAAEEHTLPRQLQPSVWTAAGAKQQRWVWRLEAHFFSGWVAMGGTAPLKFPTFAEPIHTGSEPGPRPCFIGCATWDGSHSILTGSWQDEWARVEISLIHIVHAAAHWVPEPKCCFCFLTLNFFLNSFYFVFFFLYLRWRLAACEWPPTPLGSSFMLHGPRASLHYTRPGRWNQIWFSWQSFFLLLVAIHSTKFHLHSLLKKIQRIWEWDLRKIKKKQSRNSKGKHIVLLLSLIPFQESQRKQPKTVVISFDSPTAWAEYQRLSIRFFEVCTFLLKDPLVQGMHPKSPNSSFTAHFSDFNTLQLGKPINMQLHLDFRNNFNEANPYLEFITLICSVASRWRYLWIELNKKKKKGSSG